MTAIQVYAGEWASDVAAGIARRQMCDPSTNTYGHVASSDIRKISKYTDFHNVDEDMLTGYYLGGQWNYTPSSGISYRNTDSTPSDSFDSVASICRHL